MLVPVAIVHPTDDLLEEFLCFRFLQFAMFYNVVKQFATRHILHCHKDVRGGADHLVELDDMRMSEEFKMLNFSLDFPNNIQVLDVLS